MQRCTWAQALSWRVRRHYLEGRAGDPMDVVSRLCGVQAQLLSSAELALWARVEGFRRGDLDRLLWDDRVAVKTWAMRGTLHVLAANELPVWHGGLATVRRYLRPALWKKHFGITMAQLDRLTEAIAESLTGRMLTREELVREVGRILRSRSLAAKMGASSWGTMLRPAAFTGRLCFGPSVGQRVRFTHPATWLSTPPRTVDSETATAEITRRFLAAYGPATEHDLARWWIGGGVTVARQWIASLGEEVATVDLEGQRAWILARHVDELNGPPLKRSVRLLPAFDKYVLGASYHATQILPPGLRGRVYRPQGWISPVLLVNGRMEGTWRHQMKGNRVEVKVEPFGQIGSWVRKGAGEDAERLAQFLGGSLSMA